MENLNDTLFLFLNANAHPAPALLAVARFCADGLIWLVPTALLVGWLRGEADTRKAILEAASAGLLGLFLNQLIGLVWQHPRPFMIGLGHSFMAHAADSSFPSDHLTLMWAVAMSFMAHRRTRRGGLMLMAVGLPLAWSRIYLGVHFPLDMAGAAVVAALAAWLCQRSAQRLVDPIANLLTPPYRFLFAPLIRRGWILP